MRYQIEYVPSSKAIKQKKNTDSFIRSMMRWSKKETHYEFGLKDIETINLKTGKNVKIPIEEVVFKVDMKGNYMSRMM